MKSKEIKDPLCARAEDYIKTVQIWKGKIEEFDWRIYEKHKAKIKVICAGDWKLYDWAIEKITEKLGV
jgi:hypothetical protein